MNSEKIKVIVDADLKDLIPGFLENRQKDVEQLKHACSNNDSETLRSIGHSLKGVGGGYGFDMISEIGAGIESYSKSADLGAIKNLIDELADYIDRLEVDYQEFP